LVRDAISVVVVDDAADVRSLVRAQLRVTGRFAVVGEGATGAEAIEACREHQPDIVLLDVSMPDMDGFEALPEIRTVSPHTRVVMYTGFEERGLADRARELGAAALIEKSAPMSAVVDQLVAIGRSASTRPTVTPVAGPVEAVRSEVLDEHLERFREVFEEAAIGIATMTLTGRIVRANKALAEIVGRSLPELVGIPYVELAPGADNASVTAELRRAQEGQGEVIQFEHDVAGTETGRRVSATVAPVRDVRSRPLYLFVQVQDVTQQRTAEEELRQSEYRFRLLVQAVRDYAIFMLDPNGHIASWNAGAQRIKGYAAEEIIGRHFRTFYSPDMQAIKHPEHELDLALQNGSYEEEGWRIRKDGSRFWASVVITAVFSPTGEHIGFAKVTRDMDERRRMLLEAERAAADLSVANRDLEAANERLAREAADQAQFLAVTAHELRSPISVLSGSAQLLIEHWVELDETERGDLVSSMVSSSSRLQRLLSDLLTASRLEAKAVQLSPQEVEVAAVLARSVGLARTADPGVAIELDVPSGLWVLGETDRLTQAVDNLISNAVRHGKPPIQVQARTLGDDRVEISVRDSGGGVPPELRDRLFERFVTGSGRGGTGLGLYIVRELARLHGGDAWYQPNEDGSASFLLALPAAAAPGH
jgi:hypothetical protein